MGRHSQCAAAKTCIDCGLLIKASKDLLFKEALPGGRFRVFLIIAARDRLMGMCWRRSALLCRMRGQRASA